ncbi:hypothetical protein PI124_g18650 [Phytophthora idaei]|nr:hypothetical protein PI124_g18650 [Phytophthora idaei]
MKTPVGSKYFSLIQDNASRYKWVFMLKRKCEPAQNVIALIRQLEKDHVIRVLSCNQGREFINRPLTVFLAEHSAN